MSQNYELCSKIITITKELGINQKDFVLGSGARGNSEVRFRPRKEECLGKKYAIQYYGALEKICIWDICARLQNNASLDLCYSNLRWVDIDKLYLKTVGIDVWYGEQVRVAAMPFDFFKPFLLHNKEFNAGISISLHSSNEEDEFYFNCVGLEGNQYEMYTTRYERDPNLRAAAIKEHGYECCACGFVFKSVYDIDYIEVHHIKPISSYEGSVKVNPKTDLVCVCANCHRIIHHRRTHILTIDELKTIITNVKMQSNNSKDE